MRTLRPLAVVLFLLTFGSALSQADAITWTLSGVTFSDGGIATGSFVFDPDTNSFLNWNIQTSGGNTSSFPAFTYTNTDPDASAFILSNTFIFNHLFAPPNFSRDLRFFFASPLTNAGGTVTMTQGGLGSIECFNCSPFRFIESGSVAGSTPAPVPEPATLALFGVGLTAALSRRRWTA